MIILEYSTFIKSDLTILLHGQSEVRQRGVVRLVYMSGLHIAGLTSKMPHVEAEAVACTRLSAYEEVRHYM